MRRSLALERDVSGRDTRLRGLVRVTCAETVAAHILAPSLAKLHVQHPDIMIELIPNPRELSLSMREADISVRLRQPDQHDLVVRRIGSMASDCMPARSTLTVMANSKLRPAARVITSLPSSRTSRMRPRRGG